MKYRYIDDDVIGRHWSHHPQFEVRHPGSRWRFQLERVPIGQLYCLYDDPGVGEDRPGGLMGSVGFPPRGYLGFAITCLAKIIEEALQSGKANATDPALIRLIRIRALGVDGIRAAAEPLAFSRFSGVWCVREGTHRTIAMALLGEPEVEGIVFESGQIFP